MSATEGRELTAWSVTVDGCSLMIAALASMAGLQGVGTASTQLDAGTRAADISVFRLALGSRMTARVGSRPRVFRFFAARRLLSLAVPTPRSPAEKRPARA